jgi:photosystem II stability/assembly factor-like uncharacterized protein
MSRGNALAQMVLLLCAVPIAGAAWPTTELGDWTQTTGPRGGGVMAFETRGDDVYVGLWGGGVYRSADAGLTWAYVDGLPAPLYTTDFATIGNVILVGTAERGCYRSGDGGATWSAANVGLTDGPIAEFVVHGPDLYARVGSSVSSVVHKSIDQGLTWTVLPTPTAFAAMIATDDVLLGNSALTIGNYRSYDGGLTWEEAPDGGLLHRTMDQFAAVGTTIYGVRTATSSDDAYVTTDDADNWAEVSLPGDQIRRFQAIGATFYCSAEPQTPGGPVYRSDDAATTWTPISAGLPDGQGRQVNIFGAIASTLLAGTEKGVYASDNGGTTWTAANTGLVATAIHNVMSVDGALLATVAHYPRHGQPGSQHDETAALDEVHRSIDDGQTWVAQQTGLPENARVKSLARDDQYIYAGTVRAGIFRSPDGGVTWESASTGLPEPYSDYGEIDFMVSSGGTLFAATRPRSVGGGHGSVRTRGGGIYRSDDHGMSWTAAIAGIAQLGEYNPPFSYSYYPYPTGLSVVDGVLFFATENEGLYRSTDGGASWQTVNTGFPLSSFDHYTWISAVVGLGDRLYASAIGYSWDTSGTPEARGVFVSVDGGLSWTQTALDLAPDRPVAALVADCTDLYAAVGCGAVPESCTPNPLDGVFRSRDGGVTWQPVAEMPAGIPAAPLALHGLDLATGTIGHGVWLAPVVADCDGNGIADNCEASHDADFNCDVNLLDFAALQTCVTGASGNCDPPACGVFDDDYDGDIDSDDFDAFALRMDAAAR